MLKFDALINNKIAQNIIVWLGLFLMLVVTISADNKWATAGTVVLLLAPPIYITNLLILPFFKNKKGIFFILFFTSTIVFSFILMSILNYAINDSFDWLKFMNFIGILMFVLLFGISIKLARDSFF